MSDGFFERAASYRRAAVFADKILKGAKPADDGSERPTKFEFVKPQTAKQIGLAIPLGALARADRVIRGKKSRAKEHGQQKHKTYEKQIRSRCELTLRPLRLA